MAISSKSPRKVLLVAHEAAKRSMPPYYHRFAPKKFTRHQLFACLVLKTFLKLDYRGVQQLLIDSPPLCVCIGLTAVPHWTTLHKNAERLLGARAVKKLLESTLTLLRPQGKSRRVKHAAADSTGFDQHHASRYFVWRRDNQKDQKHRPKRRVSYRRFGKLMILICCATHLVLAATAGAGPTPDIDQLDELMHRPPAGVRIEHVVADAGFDSAHNHHLLREQHGIRSTIPPGHGRPPRDGKLPADRYRRLMKTRFNPSAYAKRSQVESGFSMMKRNFGSSLRGRTYQSRRRDMLLMVLTHNIAIRLRRASRGYLQSQ